MKISLIISTYNQPDFLRLTLKSLANQDKVDYAQCEVIIADDGSEHNTTELISQFQTSYPCRLKHIWHTDDGFRKAMILNKAVAAATGDYLIFLDGDCIVNSHFVVNHLVLAESGYFIAGSRVLLSQQYTQEIIQHDIDLQSITPFHWAKLYFTKKTNKLLHCISLAPNGKWRKLRQMNWRYPKGCNVALWKADYLAINGYDEVYSGWGHEDADFFIRLIHHHVLIKDGRFSVPVYHLWHKLSSRESEPNNLQRVLVRSIDKDCIYAEQGIDQILNSM